MLSSFRTTGRKIVAMILTNSIGRNFADHAKELNNAVPTEPFFFLKPTSSYIGPGQAIEVPQGVVAHHEAVVIGKNGRDISVKDSDAHIGGYALAIDMTARNMQEKAKKSGLPWSAAKGFDTFTPISGLIAKDQIPDPHNVDLWLHVNGSTRQHGNTKDMIFSIPELIAYVSSIMTLETGDVLLTGLRNASSPTTLAELRLLVKNRVGNFSFRA
ncbi:hypothetical protein MEQU1_002329 [Malassezia equina]|uniref:Fumarylacetoacetase-like C-terminal domain-containing protein n=1 Tax=Malassezia equina TaxID=1381935 RepID=A0AAF0J451_9BASI|nr:hypothetical protein MEQU1_002329 [Malassezia equina]